MKKSVFALAVATVGAAFAAGVIPEAEFDPVKAGWQKVFEDEFEGNSLDTNKWYVWRGVGNGLVRVGDGILKIGVDYKPQAAGKKECTTKDLETGGIRTHRSFLFGYFEARVRFTRQPGWWAAFWLFGDSNTNPYVDGLEIDIFEDYGLKPGFSPYVRDVLEHNLHVYGTERVVRTWRYCTPFPPCDADWHTIGCKWTPSEMSYYMDGRLMRSLARNGRASQDVVFDSERHVNCVKPLDVLLNGVVWPESWDCGARDISKAVFPEWYCVDRVSVWDFPIRATAAPRVTWSEKPSETAGVACVREGDLLRFSAKVEPSTGTGSPIRSVSLFDSGILLETKSMPPYEFTVKFDRESYRKTRFADVGIREGEAFDDLHAFAIFARDERGAVGFTPTVSVSFEKNNSTKGDAK